MTYTPEQENVFAFIKNGEGHGIIDAVAGSGKTSTIMECSRYLPNQSDALFCAFNNSIAKEIKAKFHQQGLPDITVKTIHALGYQILRNHFSKQGKTVKIEENKYKNLLRSKTMQKILSKYYENLYRLKRFDSTSEDSEMKREIKSYWYKIESALLDINQKYRLTLPEDGANAFHALIEKYDILSKDEKQDIINYKREVSIYFQMHIRLLEFGKKASENRQVMDFADMLYLPYVWELYPQRVFSFLFVDECQDLSRAQLFMIMKHVRSDGRIMAVGDPFQAIYGFAGADDESFSRIKDTLSAQQFPLSVCFRCPAEVINLAKGIRNDITGLENKTGRVTEIKYPDVFKYAKPHDLIIARTKESLFSLVFELIDKNFNVHVHESDAADIINDLKQAFSQDERKQEISSTIGGFDSLCNSAFNRGCWIIENEANSKEKNKIDLANSDLLIKLRKHLLQLKINFFKKQYEKKKVTTIDHLIEDINKTITSTENAIDISTIHKAKGLERNRVFIIGYDKLPSSWPGIKAWQESQERNLKYVAITRAKQELYLVKTETKDDSKNNETLFDKVQKKKKAMNKYPPDSIEQLFDDLGVDFERWSESED